MNAPITSTFPAETRWVCSGCRKRDHNPHDYCGVIVVPDKTARIRYCWECIVVAGLEAQQGSQGAIPTQPV